MLPKKLPRRNALLKPSSLVPILLACVFLHRLSVAPVGPPVVSIGSNHDLQSFTTGTAPPSSAPLLLSSVSLPEEVNCSTIATIDPVKIGRMMGDRDFAISFAWWDVRTRRPNFKAGRPLQRNPSVKAIQELLRKTMDGEALVDVGANVGFMAMYAFALGRPVYAIDPISYNVAKLCEGWKANLERGYATNPSALHIYHAAAGSEYQPSVRVTRPSDKAGYFDRSSLTREVVGGDDFVEEHIPLIAVDSIIPEDQPIGVVKIDVQGNEHGVLEGMKRILGRKEGFPQFVFYEDSKEMTIKAGYEPGGCQKLLESFGYQCSQPTSGDTLCEKDRAEILPKST